MLSCNLEKHAASMLINTVCSISHWQGVDETHKSLCGMVFAEVALTLDPKTACGSRMPVEQRKSVHLQTLCLINAAVWGMMGNYQHMSAPVESACLCKIARSQWLDCLV